jgi:hypothetical protein
MVKIRERESTAFGGRAKSAAVSELHFEFEKIEKIWGHSGRCIAIVDCCSGTRDEKECDAELKERVKVHTPRLWVVHTPRDP